jgi:hypothetical protein
VRSSAILEWANYCRPGKLGLMAKLSVEPLPEAAPRILEIRDRRVLLDSDLASLYGVSTKRLNEQVRRNADRFPADFLLELSNQELGALRSQFATLNTGRGAHRKYRPVAFTEHGAIMAATILNSPRAAQMERVRGSRLREIEARRLEVLERSVAALDAGTRKQFDQVYEAILGLMSPAAKRQ